MSEGRVGEELNSDDRTLIAEARIAEAPSSHQRAKGRRAVLAAIATGGLAGSAASSQAAAQTSSTLAGGSATTTSTGMALSSTTAKATLVGLGGKTMIAAKIGVTLLALGGTGLGVASWNNAKQSTAETKSLAQETHLRSHAHVSPGSPALPPTSTNSVPTLAAKETLPLRPTESRELAKAMPLAREGASPPKSTVDLPPNGSEKTAQNSSQEGREPSPHGVSAFVSTDPLRTDPESAEAASDGLSAELALISKARESLRNRQPAEALVWIEKARSEHATGNFAQEREVIALRSLCQLGQDAQARRLARKFVETWPASPWLDQVRSSCAAPI